MDINNTIISMDNFFKCTNIPVKALGIDGSVLYSAGYTKDWDDLFNKNSIFETSKETLGKNAEPVYTTLSTAEGLLFASSRICPLNTNSAIVVFGPYTTEERHHSASVACRPANCIPHIVSLFHNIRTNVSTQDSIHSHVNSYSGYVEKALLYIRENFHRNITIEDISGHIKINKCYFCNIIKKETGKTSSQILNDIRIEKAKELLADRSLSILEVSLSVGFNNQNYFNIVFKKATMMTPLEYRKAHDNITN